MAKSFPSSASSVGITHFPEPMGKDYLLSPQLPSAAIGKVGSQPCADRYGLAGSIEMGGGFAAAGAGCRDDAESSDNESERSEVAYLGQESRQHLHTNLEAATVAAQAVRTDDMSSGDASRGGPFFSAARDVQTMFGEGPYRLPSNLAL